jgi:hypothetical protein
MRLARTLAFQWGIHDCVMSATASIDAVMGTDYYAQAQVKYPYSTEDEARVLIEANGGITGLVSGFLGDPVNWGQLTWGDVVLGRLVPDETRSEILLIHDGNSLWGPAKGGGMVRLPFRVAVNGWALR